MRRGFLQASFGRYASLILFQEVTRAVLVLKHVNSFIFFVVYGRLYCELFLFGLLGHRGKCRKHVLLSVPNVGQRL
jgi:hypothetical protein